MGDIAPVNCVCPRFYEVNVIKLMCWNEAVWHRCISAFGFCNALKKNGDTPINTMC